MAINRQAKLKNGSTISNQGAEINNWAEKVQLEAARMKLTSRVCSWFLTNKESLTIWENSCKLFKETLVGKLTSVNKWQWFNACVQKDTESVSDYIFNKLHFAKSDGVKESEAKTMVCARLRRSYDYDDASDYMQQVREHDRFNKEEASIENLNRQSKD